MSIFHVETTKKTMIDGVEYKADIKKDITINFSSTNFRAQIRGDEKEREIELIPDSMNFLHELTDIFPSSRYDIKVMQFVTRWAHIKNHVSVYFDIQDKDTGEFVYFADGPVLSDIDYDFLRDVLMRDIPELGWQTAQNYLRASIERCMGDDENSDLFTDNAWNFLSRMVSARYRDFKMDGYIDFDFNLMKDTAKEILEESLCKAYEHRV